MASGINSSDFSSFPLADFGVTVSRTPVTYGYDFHGQPVRSDGTPENITAIFVRKITEWSRIQGGLQENADAYIMVAGDQTINKEDKITINGETFRCSEPIVRGPSPNVTIYKFVNLFLI